MSANGRITVESKRDRQSGAVMQSIQWLLSYDTLPQFPLPIRPLLAWDLPSCGKDVILSTPLCSTSTPGASSLHLSRLLGNVVGMRIGVERIAGLIIDRSRRLLGAAQPKDLIG